MSRSCLARFVRFAFFARIARVARIAGMALCLGLLSASARADTPDQQFAAIAKTYFEQYLGTHPETATQLGDHRFDARSDDLSAKAVTRDAKLYRATLIELERLPLAKMSPASRIDFRILRNDLNASLFAIQVLKEYEWNPLGYNPAGAIYSLLARNFAPLPVRLAAVQARLDAIPGKLASARANLKNPPRIYTETAILQNKGALSLVQEELDATLKEAPEMRARLALSRSRAAAALEDYGKWLEKDLLPRSNRDFRLGADKYRRKLRLVLDSDLTPEAILISAEADLAATQKAMAETAVPLYRQYFPEQPEAAVKALDAKPLIRAVLGKLAEDQPNNDNVVKLAEQDLAEASAFIREKNLLTLPVEPVKVIVMPEFQRGVAVAYCDSAGALEKNGETFFSISPTPSDWTPAQVGSYFREYNRAMLKDLTIHEAMPGHYVQGAIANTIGRSNAPTLVRSVISSGTFVEGWATYAEQIMAEAGFGGAPVKMQQLKMRLRLIINAIIDQKIHAGSMTEKQAMDLMMNEGFQEEREAAGKWRRALLSSTQLSTYYVGNTELNQLRRDFEARNGSGKRREMHDRMLSQGSIAAKYLREQMGL